MSSVMDSLILVKVKHRHRVTALRIHVDVFSHKDQAPQVMSNPRPFGASGAGGQEDKKGRGW